MVSPAARDVFEKQRRPTWRCVRRRSIPITQHGANRLAGRHHFGNPPIEILEEPSGRGSHVATRRLATFSRAEKTGDLLHLKADAKRVAHKPDLRHAFLGVASIPEFSRGMFDKPLATHAEVHPASPA